MDFCDVVPKEWVEKWGKQFNRHPLGTGPFVSRSGRPAARSCSPATRSTGSRASRTSTPSTTSSRSARPTALLKLQRGEVDVLGDGVPAADLVRVQADPKWKQQIFTQPLVAISYLFMNVQMKPFDDVKVRQALSWAINRDKLVKLQGGQAMSLWQFYPKGMPGYEEGKVYYGYDPAKAKQLLADAGYPDGFKTMLYTDNVDPNPKLWQSVQADLAAVGVQAGLKTMSNNTLLHAAGHAQHADAGSFGWWMDFPDPSDWISPLFSKASAVEGGMNSSFWWSPELEKMFTAAQAMTDPAARIQKFTEMQAYIATQAPYVPCYQPIQTTMCTRDHGWLLPAPGVRDRPDAVLEEVSDERRTAGGPPAAHSRPEGGAGKERGHEATQEDSGWRVALVALLALALGLAACGGSSSSGGGASSTAAAAGQPVKGGTLTVTYQGEPTELDPAIAWELTSWGIERLTYQTFLTYASKPGVAGTELVPDLADRGTDRRERRHLRRRQDLHVPPQEGHQVRAAGQPRGQGGRLQVQLRAHDGRAARSGDVLLHRHRRGAGLHRRQGQGDHRLSRSSTTTRCRSR